MSEPCFFVLGATHHNAPLEVRERLAIESESALRADLALVKGLRELAVLNTCNRVEFYGVGTDATAVEAVQAAYCARQKFEVAEYERIRIRLTGRDAALHLFEVASGVDSQLVGENEIFGQVKDAYAVAQASGSTGSVLNRVFQKAFQAAKHVRTHTGIAAGTVSVANVAVDLATNIFGSLSDARVLVLGTGEIGSATAKAFSSRGAAHLAVAGRRGEVALEIAATLGAGTVPFEERNGLLSEFDVIVCSTAAPNVILTAASIASAMRRRPARPLLLVDLAMPRDIESGASDLQNVFLYNLDDLAKIAETNRSARESEVVRCRAILAEKADGLWSVVQKGIESAGESKSAPEGRNSAAGHAAAP